MYIAPGHHTNPDLSSCLCIVLYFEISRGTLKDKPFRVNLRVRDPKNKKVFKQRGKEEETPTEILRAYIGHSKRMDLQKQRHDDGP